MSEHWKETGRLPRRHGKDGRFDQLMALAGSGDENAVGDLWREYGVDCRKGCGRHDLD